MLTPNYIELTGADHGEVLLLSVAHIISALPVSTIQGAPRDAKSQVFMLGVAFYVREPLAKIKRLLGHESVGLPALDPEAFSLVRA